MRFLPVTLVLLASTGVAWAVSIEVNVTVPDFPVDSKDAYVCVSALLPPHPHKLVGINPHARQEVVHHILLYGCSEPHLAPTDSQPQPWRCDMKPVCDGPSTILYGWGRDAPDLQLPAGVGFSVGDQTGIKYIVVQVHYLEARPPDDHSGVTLVLKPEAVPYAAGLLSYASWFEIPPGKRSHLVENSCCFKSYQPLTMFAVRVHTHLLGKQVYMTREMWNKSGTETLVSRDPQLPQSFVPTSRHLLWPGDRLTVTCDFDSTSKESMVVAGSTHNDEMCNMYVMLYGKTPFLTMCSSSTEDIRDDSPGALPRLATLELDPSPFWRPPKPEGTPEDPLGALGDATSVTAGPDGTIWVLYRGSGVWRSDTFDSANRITRTDPAPEAVVVQLDPDNGTVLARWGAGQFYLPHMITVDAQGAVWVVDVGRHQVLKFAPDGKLLMAVGKELTPGTGKSYFCQPTQVSVLRDGSFVVADGYCNNRVVMFDREGRFMAESAHVGAVVHSVLVDECEGLVYVALREAGQVVALHLGGNGGNRLQLATTYDLQEAGHGMVWALRFGPYGEQLALAWQEGQDARLVNVRFPDQYWSLPGTAQLSPHDFVLGGAPMQLSGAGDRYFAVYVASVGAACDRQCGPLRKFVVVPPGVRLPERWELPSFTIDIHPGDAIALPHGAILGTDASSTNTNLATGSAGSGDSGEDEGGALVTNEGGEGLMVEELVIDATDYEEDKREEEAEHEAEEEAVADYVEMATGQRPNGTTLATTQVLPLEQDRFEVVAQDKEIIRQNTSIKGWLFTLLMVSMVATLVLLVSYMKNMLASCTNVPYRTLDPSVEAGDTAAVSGFAKRLAMYLTAPAALMAQSKSAVGTTGGRAMEVVQGAIAMLDRWGRPGRGGGGGDAGGGGGGGSSTAAAAAREVAEARDRERLLRSEP